MKNVLIVLLVVAVALILLGVANDSHAVDLHYVVGTWHHVSVLLLTALLAALIVVITLSAVIAERARARRVRRKLEQELDRTYSPQRQRVTMVHQPVPVRQATRPDSAAWLVVGTLVGLMAEGTGALLAFAVLAGVIALGAPRDTGVATLAVDATQVVSWLAAGVLAYEVGRRRAAVILAAALPPCAALVVLLGGVVVRRTSVSGHVFTAGLYWVAFIVLVYAGGRLWERHLRDEPAVVRGSAPSGDEQPGAVGEGGGVRPGEPLQ